MVRQGGSIDELWYFIIHFFFSEFRIPNSEFINPEPCMPRRSSAERRREPFKLFPLGKTMHFPHLFRKGKIGQCKLKNRIIMPLYPTKYAREGKTNPKMVEFYRARARGGVAMIVLDCPCLDYPRAYKGPHQLRIDTDEHVMDLRGLLDAIKSEGAKAFMQLDYPRERSFKQQVPGACKKGDAWIAPLATTMSIDEAREIMDIMVQGAVKARDVGYDGVEIQASYGCLISQLLSPVLNTRDDELGGSLQNRSKFLLQLTENVKKHAGKEFPVMVKLVCDEFVDSGLGIEESKNIARWVEKAGADAIVANAGNRQTKYRTIPPLDSPFAPLADLAAQIRSVVGIPVITIGKINRADVAEEVISSRKADFVAMARALVADPDFPRKAERGKLDEIRPCVACLEDCVGKGAERIGRCCTVNPFAGHESTWEIKPARQKKKVLVIGGGPGGLQVALVASQRGHDVELWEQSDQLGGQIRFAHLAPFKEEMEGILIYLINCLQNSAVVLRLEQPTNASDVISFHPDAVIIATGSRPGLPQIPGIDADFVVQARDIYLTGPPAGERIVVVGGGDIGCETADWLSDSGKNVSVVEIAPSVLARMKKIPRERLFKRLSEKKVRLYENTRVISIGNQSVHLKKKNSEEFSLEADLVVLGINARPENHLFQTLEGRVKEVIAVGDAASPGNLGATLRNATEAALKI
jgi:2,4-dienoyl-CoA reductase-like NADH-dependent reductase (Old Yellow Enzyme family)/thioredoxin reductase